MEVADNRDLYAEKPECLDDLRHSLRCFFGVNGCSKGGRLPFESNASSNGFPDSKLWPSSRFSVTLSRLSSRVLWTRTTVTSSALVRPTEPARRSSADRSSGHRMGVLTTFKFEAV